jgi:hypothetical protein
MIRLDYRDNMGYGGGYDANYYWIIFPTFPNQLFPSIFTITCPRVISRSYRKSAVLIGTSSAS